MIDYRQCPSGGTGIRVRLKIAFPYGIVGSSPTSGTLFLAILAKYKKRGHVPSFFYGLSASFSFTVSNIACRVKADLEK